GSRRCRTVLMARTRTISSGAWQGLTPRARAELHSSESLGGTVIHDSDGAVRRREGLLSQAESRLHRYLAEHAQARILAVLRATLRIELSPRAEEALRGTLSALAADTVRVTRPLLQVAIREAYLAGTEREQASEQGLELTTVVINRLRAELVRAGLPD